MGRLATYFPIVLALGAVILVPSAGPRAGDAKEEGPIEVDKCQAISQPGSYKLVSNLTLTGAPTASATCLTITASFVTIDLAGFTIASTSEGGTGILAQSSAGGLTGLAVRNGSISNFAAGVDLSSANGSIVEGLRIVDFDMGLAGISANGIVKNNTVTSFNNGISATGTVTGNYVNDIREVGITTGQGSTVIDNTATGGRIGISVACPSNVTDNTAVSNYQQNLVLNGQGCNNTNNVAP
jgi:hypothetical protein